MKVVRHGNLLEIDVDALVNTVNCVGYMGKGIALQFKKAFPENFKAYSKACRAKQVKLGEMFVFKNKSLLNPKYIINFPTKRHWREKSKIEDIEAGLTALSEKIRSLEIRSIAIPPLGCGLGGLDWKVVRPKIENAMSTFKDVQISLFEPVGTPNAQSMPIRTKRPEMTASRALFIKLIQQYTELAYRMTLLEIQKIAYFLQNAEEDLKLNYEAGIYGPYAHNLNKVLEAMEGHFIQGYGDSQKPDVEIELIQGATKEADQFLEHHNNSKSRLSRVSQLIEGFETPYGMELLSSVHWLACYASKPTKNAKEVVEGVRQWNDRKRNMFREKHINIAWDRLKELNWI